MPDPLVSAIVSSIIGSIAEEALAPRPPEMTMGMVRILPQETRKGSMAASPGFDHVVIDGTRMPLSPAAQIRNEFNMLIFPSMIAGPVPVRYQVDFAGAVFRIWILSAAEAQLP